MPVCFLLTNTICSFLLTSSQKPSWLAKKYTPLFMVLREKLRYNMFYVEAFLWVISTILFHHFTLKSIHYIFHVYVPGQDTLALFYFYFVQQDKLPQQPLSGMINKYGSKVRLHFRNDLDQLWISTKGIITKVDMLVLSLSAY